MTEAEWIAFLQRPEIPAFNRAMLANPVDDLPRLVFADWVEENHPHRRFAKQLRLSVNRPEDLLHCPSFPELRGVSAHLWRGRLALDFRPVAGVEVRLLREEASFLRHVLASGWLSRLSLWVQASDGVVTSPECFGSFNWADIEWLELGGHVDWQPAVARLVLSQSALFPNLRVLVNHSSFHTVEAALVHAMFASPLLEQLSRFELGIGWYEQQVTEAVRTSPHMTTERKARWDWPTDDAGANR